MRLRNFLILIFFALALVPVALFRVWPHSVVLDTEFEEVHERHLLLARNLAAALERYHRDVTATFRLLVSDPVVWARSGDVTALLENLHFRHVCIADARTRDVIQELAVARAPCPDRVPEAVLARMSARALQGGVAFGPVVAAPDGENVMHLFRPLDNGQVAIGAISTTYFRELGEAIAFGVKGHAAIVDHEGNVLSHPLPDWVAARRNIASVSAVARMMRGETGVAMFWSPALKGDMIAGFTSVPAAGWGVMIPQPVAELEAKANVARRSATLVMMVGVAGALGLALYVSIAMARPLEQVTATARRVSQGVFTAPPAPRLLKYLPLEFRDLQTGFTEMVVRLRESTRQINRLAFLDSVTGLANRECFRRRVQSWLSHAEEGTKGSLIFFDLDGFKTINDTKGHGVGDAVLSEIGARLHSFFGTARLQPGVERVTDGRKTVTIARLGGDEFAVFLPGHGGEGAAEIAEELRADLGRSIPHGGHVLSVGASVGVATFPSDASDYPALLKAADMAMYAAKRAGKNQVRTYDAAASLSRDANHDLAKDLFSPDVVDQIETYLQPVYRAGDMQLAGIEGLLRWRHPVLGLLGPEAFLGLAAELGLQRKVDLLAFESSLAAMDATTHAGARVPALSLNISIERLMDEAFLSRVLYAAPFAHELSFELMESSFSDATLDAARWSIDRLKERGIGFVLDDFGSSHASVAALLDLAPERIKLDGRLVRRIQEGPAMAGLLSSLVDMAHALDVEVVAKGVESLEQADKLRAIGVDFLQGYALNEPMTQDELIFYLCGADAFSRA